MALLSGFWSRAKNQGGASAATDARSVESWAAQRAAGGGDIHSAGGGGSAARGASSRGGGGSANALADADLDAALPAVTTPPLGDEPRLCYVDLGAFGWGTEDKKEHGAAESSSGQRMSGTLLLEYAAQLEAAAWTAWEEQLRDWEDAERARTRAAAEAARQARREEAARATTLKQQHAAAALASAQAAVHALESQGGSLPSAADMDGGRRRKNMQKRGFASGMDDMDMGGDAYAKRMRMGGNLFGAGGAGYPAGTMDVPGGMSAKRRKGDDMMGGIMMGADEGALLGGGGRPRPTKKSRQGTGAVPTGPALPAPLPWSEVEQKLLVAVVREFGRPPRVNWALVADVLGQGAPWRGVFRRPDSCRAQWDVIMATQQQQQQQQRQLTAMGDGNQGDQQPTLLQDLEGRDDDDARLQRRRTLQSLLPVDVELLKLHLERMCLVGHKYKTSDDAADPAAPAGEQAAPSDRRVADIPMHSSWGAALAVVGRQPRLPTVLMLAYDPLPGNDLATRSRVQAQAAPPPAAAAERETQGAPKEVALEATAAIPVETLPGGGRSHAQHEAGAVPASAAGGAVAEKATVLDAAMEQPQAMVTEQAGEGAAAAAPPPAAKGAEATAQRSRPRSSRR